MDKTVAQEQTDEEIIQQVFDTFADEFFSRHGKVCQEGWDCLFKAMDIAASKQNGES